MEKIRSFEEQEPKKILAINLDNNETINNNEINTMEQGDVPELKPINTDQNINNPQFPS